MRVIITGANGFIGSHITEYLVKKNIEVICLVRKKSNLNNIKDLKVKLIYGDITIYDDLEKKLKNAECIIHIAGLASDWGAYKDFYDINVNGTLNVLKAGYRNDIKNFILTSTNSVYGEENCYKKKNESSDLNSHYKYFLNCFFPSAMNYYRDTKKEAKIKSTEYAIRHGLNITFIEPVWVYGEREFSSGFYDYIKSAEKMPIMPGNRKNKFHIIYAGDLARAYYNVLTKKLKGINSFIIGNEKIEYMYRICDIFCKEAGIKNIMRLPKFLFYPIGFISELFYTIFKIKHPPLLTRSRVNMFYDNIEYSTDKAYSILGFKSETGINEGIKKTVEWYKNNNFI